MANVYTITPLRKQGLTGSLSSPRVPAGFVWVLISCDIYYNGAGGPIVLLIGDASQTIWSNHFGAVSGSQYASWRGRVCISAGNTFSVFTTSDAVDATVSAYQLALP